MALGRRDAHWDVRDWLLGREVAGCSGCPPGVFETLSEHDQRILIFKYGLVARGESIGYRVREMIQSNDSVAVEFGLHHRQAGLHHVVVAMRRLMWKCNGMKLPEAFAIFMNTNPDGSPADSSA